MVTYYHDHYDFSGGPVSDDPKDPPHIRIVRDDDRPSAKPRIQPVSRDTKKSTITPPSERGKPGKFKLLRALPCWPEIDRRIRLGQNAPTCVKAIQEEFGELTDRDPLRLEYEINRYIRDIPPAELALSAAASITGRHANRRLQKGLDELEEIERLYDMQMDRIQIDVDNEKKITKLLPSTGHEVFIALKILKQSADLKMDLGISKRQLGSMEVTGQLAGEVTQRYGSDSVGKVITDPESRRKVLGIAERLFAIAARAGIDAAQVIDENSPNPDIIDVESTDKALPAPTETDGDQGK